MSTPPLNAVRALIGVTVSDELLSLALTHPSAVGEGIERTLHSNQRLEFLGDAVLGASVAAHLYQSQSTLSEGELTLRKIALVQKPTLARAAKQLRLGEYLILGKGEDAGGGRAREAILADVLESLIGAVFVERGFEAAQEFSLRALHDELEKLKSSPALANIKNILQERTQALGLGTPIYRTEQSGGPAHARTFASQVFLDNENWGQGHGASKKDAECVAAAMAFAKLEELKASP